MSTGNQKQTAVLTMSGIALVVIQLFRLLFGGYLVGLDQYYYNDLESAISVFVIYSIIGILTTLYLLGKKKISLLGLIIFSILLLVMQVIYMNVYISALTPDPSWHSPFLNWWATVANFLFPLLTLIFAIKIYREP